PAGADRTGTRLQLTVSDSRLSSLHCRLFATPQRWVIEDAGSRNGTRVNGRPVVRADLEDGDLIEAGHTFFLFQRDLPVATSDPRLDASADELAAVHPRLATFLPSLAHDFSALARVAASDLPLVILGESGTGKEVVAAAHHALSRRRGAYVPLNCGALPANLIESELFGYKKGAFSGAAEDRLGLVRSADGGTLFLDEIAELPAAAQVTLLRVLQEREVRPIGGTRAHAVDLHVVCATHRNLDERVGAGAFRADLLARLSGFRLRLPPLRERRCDLGLLIAALLRRFADASAPAGFSIAAGRALLSATWPLNVRELESALRAGLILAAGEPIGLEHLPEALRGEPTIAAAPPSPSRLADHGAVDGEPLRDQLVALLGRHGGNVSSVAREMGKARVQIRRWCKRWGLDPESFRGGRTP
ncbi:MAG: sigma 54-interacting transcriptional regulator, partial [Polyangia bacterium]